MQVAHVPQECTGGMWTESRRRPTPCPKQENIAPMIALTIGYKRGQQSQPSHAYASQELCVWACMHVCTMHACAHTCMHVLSGESSKGANIWVGQEIPHQPALSSQMLRQAHPTCSGKDQSPSKTNTNLHCTQHCASCRRQCQSPAHNLAHWSRAPRLESVTEWRPAPKQDRKATMHTD